MTSCSILNQGEAKPPEPRSPAQRGNENPPKPLSQAEPGKENIEPLPLVDIFNPAINSVMPDLYVSWSDYYSKIESLAVKIYHSKWNFNQIVCLARGGLRVGDTLSRIYKQPLAILAATSYGGTGDRIRGSLTFSHHLTMTTEQLGSHILLVDDLVDSGTTLQQAVRWLEHYDGAGIEEVRTAVLWYKGCSLFPPDYYVDYLPDNPWIHQPFEGYEEMTPAELAATAGQKPLALDNNVSL